MTTNFEPSNDEEVKNKAFLDRKLFKTEGHLSILEKDDNEFKILSNKQSLDEALIQRAEKTTIQILYDKVFFDSFPKASRFLNFFLFVKRRRDPI